MPKTDAVIRDQFAALDAAGLSTVEIGAILGVYPRTVSRWRSESGNLRRPATIPRPASDHDRAAALIADGCCVAETARTIGVDDKTITRWFPDAPRLTKRETGYLSVLARLERKVLGA